MQLRDGCFALKKAQKRKALGRLRLDAPEKSRRARILPAVAHRRAVELRFIQKPLHEDRVVRREFGVEFALLRKFDRLHGFGIREVVHAPAHGVGSRKASPREPHFVHDEAEARFAFGEDGDREHQALRNFRMLQSLREVVECDAGEIVFHRISRAA